jgi:hypothetical protein
MRLALPFLDSLVRPALFWLCTQLRIVDDRMAPLISDSMSSAHALSSATALGRRWRSARFGLRVPEWPPPPEVREPLLELRSLLRALPEAPCQDSPAEWSTWSDASAEAAGFSLIAGDFDPDLADWSGSRMLSSHQVLFDANTSAAPQVLREAEAARLALSTLLSQPSVASTLSRRTRFQWSSVRVILDAAAVIGALRRGASRSAALQHLVGATARLMHDHRLRLRISWLDSTRMEWVDRLSRPSLFKEDSRMWWTVDQSVLATALAQLPIPPSAWSTAVDVTSWPWSKRFDRCISATPAPGAWAADVLNPTWMERLDPSTAVFSNPPFSMAFCQRLLAVLSNWAGPVCVLLPEYLARPLAPMLDAMEMSESPLPRNQPLFRRVTTAGDLGPLAPPPPFRSSLWWRSGASRRTSRHSFGCSPAAPGPSITERSGC